MRYLALATDYDGTLAHHGAVDADTVDALRRLAASGRRLILVTGRQIDDLVQVFPEVTIFDQVVGENGALIYRPERRELRTLAEPPPVQFVEALRKRGVEPLAVGHVVVATVQPNETVALDNGNSADAFLGHRSNSFHNGSLKFYRYQRCTSDSHQTHKPSPSLVEFDYGG